MTHVQATLYPRHCSWPNAIHAVCINGTKGVTTKSHTPRESLYMTLVQLNQEEHEDVYARHALTLPVVPRDTHRTLNVDRFSNTPGSSETILLPSKYLEMFQVSKDRTEAAEVSDGRF